MKSAFFLTEVAQDWSEKNLSVIQEVLQTANQATLARSDIVDDPLLNTPNLPNYRGVLRWVILQKLLKIAADSNRFDGIAATWVNLGGVSVLELRGSNTIVTPCHLLSKDDHPRESTYRRARRIENQVSPFLSGFEELAPQNEPLNLVLVHGGKDEEFAYLRAYIDPDNRSIYRALSNNIMKIPTLLPSIDFEPVAEPQVALNAEQSETAHASDAS